MPAFLPQRPLAVPSRAEILSLLLLLLAAASPLQAATVTLSSGTRSFDNSLDLRWVLQPCAAHAPPALTAAAPIQLALRRGWYSRQRAWGLSWRALPDAASSNTCTASPTPARSSAVGRTMQLLYTLTADGTLTAALVTDLTSSTEYAGLSFGAPHRGTPTVIYTTSFLGERGELCSCCYLARLQLFCWADACHGMLCVPVACSRADYPGVVLMQLPHAGANPHAQTVTSSVATRLPRATLGEASGALLALRWSRRQMAQVQ